MNNDVGVGGRKLPISSLVLIVVLVLMVVALSWAVWQNLNEKDKNIAEEAERVHNHIMETTHDVSARQGTIRLRQEEVCTSGRVCTVTVQRYQRLNVSMRYREPPRIQTFLQEPRTP